MAKKNHIKALEGINKALMDRIERDRSLYEPFGPIGIEPNRSDPLYRHALRYSRNLRTVQVKSEFDAYKQFYRLNVTRLAMKEAINMANRERPNYDTQDVFMRWVMVPHIHRAFTERYGKLMMKDFLVIMAMFHSYKIGKLSWGGFYAITKTMTECFGFVISPHRWKRVVDFCLENHFIVKPRDEDFLRSFLSRMADKSNNPVINKILKEPIHVFTPDGIKMISSLLDLEIDYVNRINHNRDFFRKARVTEDWKKEWKRARKRAVSSGVLPYEDRKELMIKTNKRFGEYRKTSRKTK